MSLVSLNTLSVGEQAYVNKLGFGANDRTREAMRRLREAYTELQV